MIDIAILGGGPAGFTAAMYAARAGRSVVVYERMAAGGQIATTQWLENYPGFPEGVGGPEFAQMLEAQAKRAGAEVLYREVKRVELEGEIKKIQLRKETVEARAVILCMGAEPRKLGVPGESRLTGFGVSYCATCDAAFFQGKDVAVVGGGDTAVEDALVLERLCRSVTLIHRRDALRAQQALQERLQASGVSMLWNSAIVAIEGEEKVERIRLKSTVDETESERALDGVFVAVGRNPNNALVQGLFSLDENGYVRADEHCRTELAGVYVAGDLRTKELRQVVTAVADGAVAAFQANAYLTMFGYDTKRS